MLTHKAGELGDEDFSADASTKTMSRYEVMDKKGRKLAECSSSLSDPKFCGEFEAYHRANDSIAVMHSPSGSTILIIEDRSPNFPNQEHRIIQIANGASRAFKLRAERIHSNPHHPLDSTYATVLGISDTDVFYMNGEKSWSKTIEELKHHDS